MGDNIRLYTRSYRSETTNMVSKKVGLILIIVGILIPSVLYPFTQLSVFAAPAQTVMTQNVFNRLSRWQDLEIVFIENGWYDGNNENKGQYIDRIAVPFYFIGITGITIFFIGIAFIVSAKINKEIDGKDPIRLIAKVNNRNERGGDRKSDEVKSKGSSEPIKISTDTTADIVGTASIKVEKAPQHSDEKRNMRWRPVRRLSTKHTMRPKRSVGKTNHKKP